MSVDTDMTTPTNDPFSFRLSSSGTVGPLTIRESRGSMGLDTEDGADRLYDSLMKGSSHGEGSMVTGPGPGGGDNKPVKGFSNRNSHPFTEREVEQTFQQMKGEE